jgi:glucosylceramidase
VWLTKGDRSVKLERQPDVAFVPGPGQSLERRIAIHEERKEQVIDGFGAALTDSSAWLISRLHERRRWPLLTRLFSREGNGIGLSCLRLPIGSSDFSLTAYTYEDDPQKGFTIQHDRAYIIPVLRSILRANPDLWVVASPWTAPAYLKDNGLLYGGSLKNEPNITQDYSHYLVRFIKAYEQEGIPIHAITPQNEPCHEDANLPSMKLDWWDLVNIVVYDLADSLAAAEITTDIILYDHNWENTDPNYVFRLLDDLQVTHNRYYQVVAGTAFHCYEGTPASQSLVHDAHPDKGIYFTECTGHHLQDQGPDDNFADDLVWETQNLIIGATRHWARSVILWNLALDPNGGPHLPTACGEKDGKRCRGVVTIDNESRQVSYHVEYYVLGHASKFVETGAHRIESDTYDGTVETVAFQNPDGSAVLIVLNPTSEPQRFSVWWRDQFFTYTLDDRSVATFRWN